MHALGTLWLPIGSLSWRHHLMVLQIAGVRNNGVVRMSKKFARRARLIREVLRVATIALRFVKLVLEVLDKAANCDARKLRLQVQVA